MCTSSPKHECYSIPTTLLVSSLLREHRPPFPATWTSFLPLTQRSFYKRFSIKTKSMCRPRGYGKETFHQRGYSCLWMAKPLVPWIFSQKTAQKSLSRLCWEHLLVVALTPGSTVVLSPLPCQVLGSFLSDSTHHSLYFPLASPTGKQANPSRGCQGFCGQVAAGKRGQEAALE